MFNDTAQQNNLNNPQPGAIIKPGTISTPYGMLMGTVITIDNFQGMLVSCHSIQRSRHTHNGIELLGSISPQGDWIEQRNYKTNIEFPKLFSDKPYTIICDKFGENIKCGVHHEIEVKNETLYYRKYKHVLDKLSDNQ